MSEKTYRRTLTIAGSDSSGGAGIQADLKTFAANGCYGMSVITALTAQNTQGVAAIHAAPVDFVAKQLDAVLADVGADAVKIGMLFSPELIETVARKLKEYRVSRIVLDPVMVAQSGDKLLRDDAVDALKTHLIPLVLDAAAGTRPSVTVYGSDYDTADGTCIRDYIHVSDLADAHVLAMRALLDGAKTTAYNLGNGAGFSVREVIDCARRVTGRDIAVAEGARRPGDPAVLVGDAHRIRTELGWSPRLADLEAIIATAWRWHQRSHRHSHGP